MWKIEKILQATIPEDLAERLSRHVNAKAKSLGASERVSLSRLVALVLSDALDAMEKRRVKK
jgi:hypothetical protein